jgi:hypothetical protein
MFAAHSHSGFRQPQKLPFSKPQKGSKDAKKMKDQF